MQCTTAKGIFIRNDLKLGEISTKKLKEWGGIFKCLWIFLILCLVLVLISINQHLLMKHINTISQI